MVIKRVFPAVLIAGIVLASFGVICFGHLLTNKPLVFLDYIGFGIDFRDFFEASQRILQGLSPYASQDNRYVTTPIPALATSLLVPLGFDNARKLLYILIPLSIYGGYALLVSIFDFEVDEKNLLLVTGGVMLLFGYPSYFLVQRGNIDGWVFLFLCLGLWAISRNKHEIYSGLFLALAIGFKLYPILILIPILLARRWRLMVSVGLWLAVMGIITLIWISDFRDLVLMRSRSIFRLDENGSLVATVAHILIFLDFLGIKNAAFLIIVSPVIASLIYGVMFGPIVYADYKLGRAGHLDVSSFILYIPFMIAIPQTVYHYSLILCFALVPLLCHLWKFSKTNLERVMLLIIAVGIAMTQWQAIATYNLTGNLLSHSIPGFGLLLVMMGILAYKASHLKFVDNLNRIEPFKP